MSHAGRPSKYFPQALQSSKAKNCSILHFFAYMIAVGLVFQKVLTLEAYVKVVKCAVSH